jgi:ABC-2 type transport system permease protein
MIGAILRAQWLSMRWGGRRGATWSIVTACLWYGFWSSVALMISALARGAGTVELQRDLPLAFLLIFLYWQIVPVISASMGSGLDMRKLLVYPTPHAKLFLVEVMLRLTTGGEMLLVLAGGGIGLLLNQKLDAAKPGSAIAILVPILIWVALNAMLASGLRSLIERLLARRRLREILVFLLVLATAAPRMLLVFHVGPRSFGSLAGVAGAAVLPWAAAARVILGPERLLWLLTIGLWTLAAAWFGRAQFERSLRYDAMAAQATPAGARSSAVSWTERFFRLPSRIFRDPLAVLVEKELRSLARTPRFRMVFVMGFAFGLMVWVPLVLGGQAERNGWLEQNLLTVISVYALTLLGQVTYWNCFGFDRSAIGIYLAAPQPIRLTLVGKNIASLVFVYLEVVILSLLTAAFRLTTGVGKVMETVLVVGVSSLYMLAFGNISSVQYPRALKPERVSQGGASSRFQALVFILYPLALVPVAMAYFARYALDSELAFGIALACATALGGFIYWLGLDSAVQTATRHRERMLMDLSGGEGPIASD